MRFSVLKTPPLFTIRKGAVADWMVEAYEPGYPAADKYESSVGFTAGTSSDELWCVGIASAHNFVAMGIKDAMNVTFFSDPECQYVIPENVTILHFLV
ncbi:hypothetical protein F4678DRAFT_468167 [Xylaria arbuscula]|nr:hypothetical protein F4678DRAFT_468167 [Xylaria arbuscula]